MKILKCKLCLSEADIVGNDRSVHKKIKCSKCHFTNNTEPRSPEVVIIRKRTSGEP